MGLQNSVVLTIIAVQIIGQKLTIDYGSKLGNLQQYQVASALIGRPCMNREAEGQRERERVSESL